MSWYVSLSGLTFSQMKSLGFESSWMKCLNFVTSSGMKFIWMKNSQMKMTWYVSASGITSIGWNILDENSWCVTFCDYIFGWKCLDVVTCWDFIFGWKFLDVVTLSDEISWMNDLMLKYLGCNVLILTFHEMFWMNVWILTWQFLDEIGASLLLKPVCFRSIGKRAWMSGDCIGTVAVAEKGERWQAHVQRIQAPPLLLASSSSSKPKRNEETRRHNRSDKREYVMPYFRCFLERWTWVSLHLLSPSSSLYRSASNTIYIFEAAQWFFTCKTRKSEFPEDSVTVVFFRAICSVKARHIRRQRARGIGAGVRRSHDFCVG